MKRTLVFLLALVIVSIIGGVFYITRTYFPKHRWQIDYKKSSDEPYGLLYFYKLLKDREAGTTLIYNQAYWQLDGSTANSNFIYAGADLDADSSKAAALLDFVSRGNRALIASDETPWQLILPFFTVDDTINGFRMYQDTVAHLRFLNDSAYEGEPLYFNYQHLKNTAAPYSWGGFPVAYFGDTIMPAGFKPLIVISDTIVSAFYIDHGKGRLIFHANPITLTNYHLARQEGFLHAAKLVAALHDGHTYWDDRTPGKVSNSGGGSSHKNPLKFLFSHPSLVWAWYLFLTTVLLYIIFRSKREQRVIPILPVNQNDSLAYVKTVGTLYYKHGGQKHIAGEMYTLFLADLRARYHLSTDVEQNTLIGQVISRSGAEEQVVKEVFRAFNYVLKASSATSADLIHLHKTIETFNKSRK